MKWKYIFLGFLVFSILAIIISIWIVQRKRDGEIDYAYKVIYYDESIPGTQYDIYIGKSYSIHVEKQSLCSTVECLNGKLPEKETYDIDLSFENQEVTKKFIQDLFSETKEKVLEIHENNLSEKNQSIMLGILTGEEIYFDFVSERKLFEISSNRLDCETVVLIVFDDNRYKYIYGYEEGELKYRKGTYTYSIKKLMETLRKPSILDQLGPYDLRDKEGNRYTLYDTNKELKAFLESIPVHLDVCMER